VELIEESNSYPGDFFFYGHFLSINKIILFIPSILFLVTNFYWWMYCLNYGTGNFDNTNFKCLGSLVPYLLQVGVNILVICNPLEVQ